MELQISYHIFAVTAVAIIFTPETPAAVDSDHLDYVAHFGNNVNTSGAWLEIRRLAANRHALEDYCMNAYSILWPYRLANLANVSVVTEMLSFPGTEYSDIRADFLICQTRGSRDDSMVLTKGLNDDCMYQCRRRSIWDPITVFELSDSICGFEL